MAHKSLLFGDHEVGLHSRGKHKAYKGNGEKEQPDCAMMDEIFEQILHPEQDFTAGIEELRNGWWKWGWGGW